MTKLTNFDHVYSEYKAGNLKQAYDLCCQLLDEEQTNILANQLLPIILFKLGRSDDALVFMQQVVDKYPDLAESHYSLSLMQLWNGDFVKGWREYEWRLTIKSFKIPQLNMPRWTGFYIDSKTILILWEQGYGDCIQFSRYLPLVKQKCNKLVVVCPPRLIPLFQKMGCIDELIDSVPAQTEKLDCYACMASLPRIFAANYGNIPDVYDFHSGVKESINRREKNLNKECLKVGIAWSGRANNENQRFRSCQFQYFQQLLTVEGIQLVTLQLHDKLDLNSGDNIYQAGLSLKDFGDTAELIEQLDLVISVDTVVAHLACTLGKETWVLLSRPEDWRWVEHRGVCPWYPDARLFKQSNIDDWKPVFAQVKAALNERLGGLSF